MCSSDLAPRLVELGLADATITQILDDDCPGLDPLDRLVRDYAIQVTRDHNRVGDPLFDRLREHFDEAQIVELTLRITLCTFFNKFNDVMQLNMEEEAAVFYHDRGTNASP